MYDGEVWYSFPRDESFDFFTVVVDYNNRQFWGGGDNSEGLRIYDGDDMTVYTELFGESFNVLSLAVDSQNIKWIGTIKSLFRYDDSEFKQVISFESFDYDYFWVSDIEIDVDGSVWFVVANGSDGSILAKYTPEDSTTSVETEPLPEELPIVEAHPNPFNPRTTISYSLPEAMYVSLNIYSITGQKVATLVNGFIPAGNYNVIFDGSHFASGLYIYRFQAGDFMKTGKIVMVR